jgi:hypothetical protein
VASYRIGKRRERARVCRRLLDGGELPCDERPRAIENLNFAERAMQGQVRRGDGIGR